MNVDFDIGHVVFERINFQISKIHAPSNISRKLRNFAELKNFKSSELQNVFFYLGIICLKYGRKKRLIYSFIYHQLYWNFLWEMLTTTLLTKLELKSTTFYLCIGSKTLLHFYQIITPIVWFTSTKIVKHLILCL